jgi:hypothetical protein
MSRGIRMMFGETPNIATETVALPKDSFLFQSATLE